MKSVKFSKRSAYGNYRFTLDINTSIMFSGKFFVALKSLLLTIKTFFLKNKTVEKYISNSIIGIGVIGILSFCYWGAVVSLTFIAALAPNRSPGSIAESGIYFFKEFPVLAIITMVIAVAGIFFLKFLLKDDSRKE